jgi:hypothetical protein
MPFEIEASLKSNRLFEGHGTTQADLVLGNPREL